MAKTTTFADRLQSLMLPGEKQIAFAERISVSQGTLSTYLSNNALPQKRTLEIIGQKLDVDPAWLRNGRGPRRKYPLKGNVPVAEEMQNNLAFAGYLDAVADSTSRYDTLAAELESLIKDCDARRANYVRMLADVHRAFDKEVTDRLNPDL